MILRWLILFVGWLVIDPVLMAQTKNGVSPIDTALYHASYLYDHQEDSISDGTRKHMNMSLLIGRHCSLYEHGCFTRMDSMFYNCPNINDASNRMKIGRLLTGDPFSHLTKYRVVKRVGSNKVDTYENISSAFYHIEENVSVGWQLMNKADTVIAGYHCKEAHTVFRGRNYKAWYTLSIPISDGPFKFKGLPGLIVKLEDADREHCFELSYFEKIESPKPMLMWDKKFVDITIQQYPKLKHNETLDKLRKYGNPQMVNVAPEKLGKVETKILSRNNLIERL